MELLVKTLAGLEEVLARELTDLGAANIRIQNRAVACEGDRALLYRANLWLRCAVRILIPIHHFHVPHEEGLYEAVRRVDWSRHIQLHQTFAIQAVTQSRRFNHSQYLALKTKDAIVDWFRDRTGRRPSVNPKTPDLRFNLHVDGRDEATLSLDASGDGLHRRGYRTTGGAAPLNEVLAAGMIQLSGWAADRPFVDFMCGSGTLLIEAASFATRQAPGLYRKFAFEQWQDFDTELWRDIKADARARRRPYDIPILGCDRDFKAFRIAENNIRAAHLQAYVRVKRSSFQNFLPPEGPGTVVTNPPYGLRIDPEDINGLYREIGDKLKQHYAGYEAWILSGNIPAIKSVGLRPSRKIHLLNSQLPCKFHKFELYAGSKK